MMTVAVTLLGLVLLIVPGIYFAVCFTLVMPIAAIEGCGAVEVMRRSWNLSRGRRGTIFLSSFAWGALIFLSTLLATLLLTLVAGVLRSSVVGSGVNYDYSALTLASTRPNFDRSWEIFTDVALRPSFTRQDVELMQSRLVASLRDDVDDRRRDGAGVRGVAE